MNRYFILKGIKIMLLVVFAITALGFVVMWLWNALLPEIFGLPEICFWQALGLLILSKILFGGCKMGGGGRCHGGSCSTNGDRHSYWKQKMQKKMEGMSETEREAFKKKLARCGWNPDQPETTKE